MTKHIPKHIAIILDGNRRYARNNNLKLYEGHRKGLENVENLIRWCYDLGIKELTLYSFSVENFRRKPKEIIELMKLFKEYVQKLIDGDYIKKYNAKVRFIGRLNKFSSGFLKKMNELMQKSSKNKGIKVNFALGYGGRAEIVDAVNKIISKKIKKVNENTITKSLYLPSEPELMIRTGGDIRVSNFLIWQSAYTELWFTKKLWPEFTKRDLTNAIEDFNKRKRNFGA